MADFKFPQRRDFADLVRELKERRPGTAYLPNMDAAWIGAMADAASYVEATERFSPSPTIGAACARLLYKVVKKHALSDGNKRSAVIAVLFLAEMNGYDFASPSVLEEQAKRVARSRGRSNESLICGRVAAELDRSLTAQKRRNAA